MNPEEGSFESRLQSVQDMIAQIEQGKLPLEDSVRQYEQGMKILKALETELGDMNRRLTVLQQGADGTDQERPLRTET